MKKYRFIWLPVLLFAYGIAIALYNKNELIASGQSWRLWLSVAIDMAVCLFLAIFLKKRRDIDNR